MVGCEKLTENQHGIVNEPVLDAPGLVARVAIAADNEDHPAETNVRAIRLEPTIVRQSPPVEILRFAGSVEGDVGDAHDDIINHAASRNLPRVIVSTRGRRSGIQRAIFLPS